MSSTFSRSTDIAITPTAPHPVSTGPTKSRLPDDTPQRFVLDPAKWENYVLLSDGVGDRRIRVTFDGERVEIMAVSNPHEFWKTLLRQLFELLCVEAGVNCRGYGNTTLRKQNVERGIEPDECYYVRRFDEVRGKIDLDMDRDPAPDFMIEIEISRSVVDRLSVLAKLGVLEVWRYDGEQLTVMLLRDDGQYFESNQSRIFPNLPLAEFGQLIQRLAGGSLVEITTEFRKWLRECGAISAGN